MNKKWKIKVNTEKTELIAVGRRTKTDKPTRYLILRALPIKLNQDVKYVDRKLIRKKHIEEPDYNYEVTIKQVMTYDASIWGQAADMYVKKLENIQNNALRKIK